MKYCPYCGAALPDGSVSFCTECGNALPGKKESNEQPDAKKKEPVKRKQHAGKRGSRTAQPVREEPVDEMQAADDDYDGYYDDIPPVDEGRQREGVDWSVVKKIAALVGGLAVVIGACIALMYLL